MSDISCIDLFAGIGGIRLGFESIGAKCIYSSEWNKFSARTYCANFPIEMQDLVSDISKIDENTIPDHDILLAGFPCQPFSLAGISKNSSLGRGVGFEHETQGTLFFDVARIIRAKNPSAFLLENVKHLIKHDNGNTFNVIRKTLEDELGYHLYYRVIDGRHYVPQHRERVYIVGFRDNVDFSFDDLIYPSSCPKLSSILHPEDGTESPEEPYTVGDQAKVNDKYTLSPNLWDYLQEYKERQRAKGNGFGYGLVERGGVARTLSARYYKDGSEILLSRGEGRLPRMLTPRECARLMGFPDAFNIPVSDAQAYRQFGNSVVVPVISEIAKMMKPCLS